MIDKEYLNKIAPIVKEKLVWDAFIVLIDHEEQNLMNLLSTQQTTDNLIRINAKLQLLAQFKRYRDTLNGG